MRDQCIRAVNNALAKKGYDPLTQVQERGIEQRVGEAMNVLARQDAAGWHVKTLDERYAEAGARAAEGVVAEAAKKTQRIGLAIIANDRNSNYINAQVANGSDRHGVDALERRLVAKYDRKGGDLPSMATVADATFEDGMRQLADVFDLVSPGMWGRVQRGIIQMEPMRRAFTEALHGVTKDIPPEIVKAAKVYHEVAETMRQTFNAAGGIVGKLEDFGAPHSWDSRLAATRYQGHGSDARTVARHVLSGQFKEAEVLRNQMAVKAQESFAEDMTNWSNPQRYAHDDGTLYTRDERREFFKEAWRTIVSGGVTKDTRMTAPGGGIKANRGAQHRVIHLLPEFAYDAIKKYSGRNPLQAMEGGLRRMARDIAAVEAFGPSADAQWEQLLGKAMHDFASSSPRNAIQSSLLRHKEHYLRNLYDSVVGNNPPPASRPLADTFAVLRADQVMAKLGQAIISSISDYGTLYQTALYNHLNPFKIALNSALIWSPKSKRYVRRMGLMLDSLRGAADRFATDNLTARDLSSRTASALIRAQGLEFATNARQVGFSVTMMDAIGHLTRQRAYADVSKLSSADRAILANKGVSQRTWDIWRAAQLDRWGANHTLLTPDNIMAVPESIASFEERRRAATDLLGIVKEEQDLAIIAPGHRERTQMALGTDPGTIAGEMVRSVMLFKSFPWTMTQRHMERGLSQGYGAPGYLAALFISMTIGGALSNWVTDLLNGRDPRNLNVMTDSPRSRTVALRNWVAASMRGGGVGVFGDFLFSSKAGVGSGNSITETLAGPNVGSVAQAQELLFGNAIEAIEGQDAHAGSEWTRFARAHTPFANLWYTKALTDRLIFNQLSELTDPGYEARMREYAQQQGSGYWWGPTAAAPERAPDWENATRAN